MFVTSKLIRIQFLTISARIDSVGRQAASLSEARVDEVYTATGDNFISLPFFLFSRIPERDGKLKWLKSLENCSNLSSANAMKRCFKPNQLRCLSVYAVSQVPEVIFRCQRVQRQQLPFRRRKKVSFLITNNKWFLFWLICAGLRTLPRFQPSCVPQIEWNVHLPKNWVIKCERVGGKVSVPCWYSTRSNP